MLNRMKSWLVFTLALPCFGATSVTTPSKGDITATQAVIRVTTDQAGNCTYRLSEGSSLTTSVNDVNPALFSGADSDARPGSIITATTHVFVAGTRTAARASNGKYYSRSLQANTQHWVGVTCGTDPEVSTTFWTANPPAGNSAPEITPFDSNAFGNVAAPSIDWVNKSTTYNDSQWGTQLHRATGPEDVAWTAAAQTFTYGVSGNGHWSNPGNAISAGAGLATCDTSAICSNSDALFLAAVIPNSATNYLRNGGWEPAIAFLDFLVRVWGSGTDASAANRTISICLTIDSQTCFTAAQNIVLPQGTPAFAGTLPKSWSVQSPWSGVTGTALTNITVASGTATVNFASAHGFEAGQQICVNGIRNQSVASGVGGNGLNGCHTITSVPGPNSLTFSSNAAGAVYADPELVVSATFPQAQWASWSKPPLHSFVGSRGGGTITSAAGSLVLSGSGASASTFNIDWVSGTKIFIDGSSPTCANNLCTISSVTDVYHATISENLSISNANWTNADFGVLIKKTSLTGAVSVSTAYDFVFSSVYNSGLDGSGDICNSNYVTVSVDAAGNPISPSLQGYLCVATATGTSQATTPVYLFIPSTGETRLIARNYQPSTNDYTKWVGWHPTDGASWFVSKSGTSYFKATYSGDYRQYTPGFPQSTTEPSTPEQLTFTDILSGTGNDIASQINNCKANGLCDQTINGNVFPIPPAPPQTGAAVKGNYLLLCGGAGGQDSPGYMTMFDVSVIPAQLKWAGYTWDKFPVGYAGIHACLNFGSGQWNALSLNSQLGQVGGTMQGPWQIAPTMVDVTGNGYLSNTSIQPTDGFDCPAGLDAKWQAIGAKPQAEGGLPLCIKIKIPGEPCSVHATATESANFPCPWNSAPNYSMLKATAEGDTVHDARYGPVSFGEYAVIVKKQVNSVTDIDLWVYRYRLAPAANFGSCGSGTGDEMTHLDGWTMQMAPYLACFGGQYWMNTLDPSRQWYVEDSNISGGGHSDFGEGTEGSFTYVHPRYLARPNQMLPAQIGTPANVSINGNPAWGSTQVPDVFLQDYPSKRQQAALTPASELSWFIDVRSYNPSAGNPQETGEGLFGNRVSLVNGTTQTYLITFPNGQTPDPKHTGFIGWAGYHQLGDKSGPSSTIGDLDSYRYCYVYNAGECVAGSTAGQMYVSVPHDTATQQCLVNWYAENATCISNQYPYGFWVAQWDSAANDPQGTRGRRLTSAFVAPGRQYNFTNAKPTPDGKWLLVQAEWLEGQRTDMFWLKLPPWPAISDDPGSNPFSSGVSISRGGAPGDSMRVAFGYGENGSPASFFCTSRAEKCYASAEATIPNPFLFASEGESYTACAPDCTVNIPAISGRVLYYQVEWKNGSTVTTEPPQVVAVP